MKKINLKAIIFALSILGLTSCNDAEYSVLTDSVYISQTSTNGNSVKKLLLGTSQLSESLNASVSSPTTQGLTLKLVLDSAALKAYNQRNSTSYEMLPESFCQLSTSELTIAAGKTISNSASIIFQPLSQALLNTGKKYAVAVRLVSDANSSQVLKGGDVFVYVLDRVPIVSTPIISPTNNVHFTMRQDYALNEWTVEFCVNASVLGHLVGQLNNQTLFRAAAPSGKSGSIYTRFGDAFIEGDKFQVKTQGTQLNSNTRFTENRWYHIAIVCASTKLYIYVDGKLDSSMDLPGSTTYLDASTFAIGNTDYLKANLMMSEVRFWTVARSQAEIENNMYSIAPDTKGLEAYWKMDESAGNDFTDSTGNGNKGVSTGTTQWVTNVRIDGK